MRISGTGAPIALEILVNLGRAVSINHIALVLRGPGGWRPRRHDRCPSSSSFAVIRPDAAHAQSPEEFMLVSNQAAQPTAGFADYVAIARPDHWIKHVLIIPGVAFAMIMSGAGAVDYTALAERLLACVLVAMALSS